jgi:hypothetical protein
MSLVGTFGLMFAFGYSLDNISLLGITIAVGLVVDDAIVVLENIMRHIEDGHGALRRGLKGLGEVGLHHGLDLGVAGGGVHPDLLHAGRDRPAVPRVRAGGGAGGAGVGAGVADAGADAGELAPAAGA